MKTKDEKRILLWSIFTLQLATIGIMVVNQVRWELSEYREQAAFEMLGELVEFETGIPFPPE